ncbi:hypothetical protein C8R31_101440 [Nitrosospira sp. Nsp2]|uniref:hypothetical protein n=1 Tax=Nitrosospira sp. Nsp2 TaxID=136548 RepID=UPI000D46AA13|nr:hypothetical protein [Nitrosospira sp. Nsp2]PTR17280.1 hypothetical protein C8R31_101440 [Nitrosospira sp. Nsp2]
MKIRCNRWAVLAVVTMSVSQAAADEGSLGGYPEAGASQAKPQAQDNTPSKPWEAKPWETKPWEAAQEELRPGGRKAMEERRRAGRKARKERLENRNENIQPVGGSAGGVEEPLRDRQSKWRRHQMESQRYYPAGMK